VVFSSGDYDMAVLGWRLAEYPGYLCEWFQPPSPLYYGSEELTSACVGLTSTADLETARQAILDVQSVLVRDLPFIPLYQSPGFEAYRAVSYPFGTALGGVSGLYGAPQLAVPAQ
jgi:hypothetical protein